MSNDQRNNPAPDSEASDSLAEEALSVMALSLEDVTPAPEVRARLLTQIAGPERFAPLASTAARTFGVPIEAAREALRLVDDPSVWAEGLMPGAVLFSTPALRAAHVVIARLPPRTRIPGHLHDSRETTLVLDGCLIEDGHRPYGPGAVLDMSAGSRHEVAVPADTECLVVFFPFQY
jgi:quercetin dioxygenase-like cupin family protein